MGTSLTRLKKNVELSVLLVICGLLFVGALLWSYKNSEGQFSCEMKYLFKSVINQFKFRYQNIFNLLSAIYVFSFLSYHVFVILQL